MLGKDSGWWMFLSLRFGGTRTKVVEYFGVDNVYFMTIRDYARWIHLPETNHYSITVYVVHQHAKIY